MLSPSLFCDICGAANRPQAQFCVSCGHRLYLAGGGSIHTTVTGLLVPHYLIQRRYCIVEQVGKGGFGAVYKAEDTFFGNRLVAVKEMRQNGLSQEEVLEAIRAFQVDSSVLSYRMAACLAFRDALKQVKAVPVQVQLESLAHRQQAVGAWNSWRVREPKSRPNLRGIDLSGGTWSDELLRANGLTPVDLS